MSSESEICVKCVQNYIKRTGLPFDYFRCDECRKGYAVRRDDAIQGKGFGKHDMNNPLWNIKNDKKSPVK
jgi:hypothetical protein